jgi:hypothetical protein
MKGKKPMQEPKIHHATPRELKIDPKKFSGPQLSKDRKEPEERAAAKVANQRKS